MPALSLYGACQRTRAAPQHIPVSLADLTQHDPEELLTATARMHVPHERGHTGATSRSSNSRRRRRFRWGRLMACSPATTGASRATNGSGVRRRRAAIEAYRVEGCALPRQPPALLVGWWTG